MIGDGEAGLSRRLRQVERRQIFGDVLGQRRDARRLLGIGRIEAQHEAVVLDRRAAARRGDDDGVEPAVLDLARPGVDVAARRGERCFLAAHMMDQRAAAGLALRHHDLDAEPGQQPDRRLVDAGLEHRLRAAGEDRDAAAPSRLRRHGRPGARHRRRGGTVAGASASIAREAASAPASLSNSPAKGRPSLRQRQRGAEARRDAAARRPAWRGSAGRAAAAGRSSRYGRGHGRPGACS